MFPRILHLYGPLWIQSYGLMIAVGFFTFLFLTHRHPIRQRIISSNHYIDGVFWSLFVGIAGARIFYIMTDPELFLSNPIDIFFPWVGGFTVVGSIVAVLIFAPWYLRMCGVGLFPMLDLVAVYAPLMQAVARFGCLLAGCCYGLPASDGVFWAITFTDPLGIAPLHVALHPTQLYAALASLFIFLSLSLAVKYFKVKPGAPLFGYLLLEAMARIIVDFWRGDRGDLLSIGLFGKTISLSHFQWVSVGLIIVASIGLLMCLRSTKTYSFGNYGSV